MEIYKGSPKKQSLHQNDNIWIYAATPYSPDFIEIVSHGFETMIDPCLFWETLLVTLWGEIIRFAKRHKREARKKEKELETSITELNNIVNSGQ